MTSIVQHIPWLMLQLITTLCLRSIAAVAVTTLSVYIDARCAKKWSEENPGLAHVHFGSQGCHRLPLGCSIRCLCGVYPCPFRTLALQSSALPGQQEHLSKSMGCCDAASRRPPFSS
eukprot:s3750_g4.t2